MVTRKKVTSAIAIIVIVAVLLTGTLALTTYKTALNQFINSITDPPVPDDPIALLHDDFEMNVNKDVYVENISETEDIFIRIQLWEKMVIGSDNKADAVLATDPAKSVDFDNGFVLHKPWKNPANNNWLHHLERKGKGVDKAAGTRSIEFQEAFVWVMGQEPDGNDNYDRYFMPGQDLYEEGSTTYEFARHDPVNVGETENGKTATKTDYAPSMANEGSGPLVPYGVISRSYYASLSPTARKAYYGWIYDEDGWAYWSQPLEPGHATGFILDNVTVTDKYKDQDYYYAIDVRMEAITRDEEVRWNPAYHDNDGPIENIWPASFSISPAAATEHFLAATTEMQKFLPAIFGRATANYPGGNGGETGDDLAAKKAALQALIDKAEAQKLVAGFTPPTQFTTPLGEAATAVVGTDEAAIDKAIVDLTAALENVASDITRVNGAFVAGEPFDFDSITIKDGFGNTKTISKGAAGLVVVPPDTLTEGPNTITVTYGGLTKDVIVNADTIYYPDATAVTFSPNTLTVTAGQTVTNALQAAFTPSPTSSTYGEITFTTDKGVMASINATTGLVTVNATAATPGTATIRAMIGTTELGSFTVTVSADPTNPTGLEITAPNGKTTYDVTELTGVQLSVKFTPSTATGTPVNVEWKSDNESLVTVDSTGKISYAGNGSQVGAAKITAKDSNGFEAEITIGVIANEPQAPDKELLKSTIIEAEAADKTPVLDKLIEDAIVVRDDDDATQPEIDAEVAKLRDELDNKTLPTKPKGTTTGPEFDLYDNLFLASVVSLRNDGSGMMIPGFVGRPDNASYGYILLTQFFNTVPSGPITIHSDDPKLTLSIGQAPSDRAIAMGLPQSGNNSVVGKDCVVIQGAYTSAEVGAMLYEEGVFRKTVKIWFEADGKTSKYFTIDLTINALL